MAKKIPSRKRLAMSAAILIARNKRARHLAARTGRSIMRHRTTRRAALRVAKPRRRSHGRPKMIGVASVGAISAAGAAVYARNKRGGKEHPAKSTD